MSSSSNTNHPARTVSLMSGPEWLHFVHGKKLMWLRRRARERVRKREYQRRNRELVRARNRAYYYANRERILVTQAIYKHFRQS